MAGSIGKVIIPVVSTFDPSGIAAAKAGLKEMQNASGGSGGGSASGGAAPRATRQSAPADDADRVFEQTRTANEKYAYQVSKLEDLHKRGRISTETFHRAQKQAAEQLPKSPGMMQRMGIGRAGTTLADQFGLGGVASGIGGMGAAGIVAGAAVAGVAIYALTQKVAGEAVALKDHARELNVSTSYYAGLTAAAHKAGTSVENVTQGLSGMRAMTGGALTGDIGAALLFQSMGISRSELESGFGDTKALSQTMLRAASTPGQKATIFGNVAAANAIQGANEQEHPWYAPSAGSTQAAAGLAADASGFLVKGIGEAVMNVKSLLPKSWGGASFGEQEQAAQDKEEQEREGKLQAERTKIGMAALPGLLNPEELASQRMQAGQGIFDEFGKDKERYEKLHAASIHEQQTGAEAAYLRPQDLADRQLSDWKEKSEAGGYSNEMQSNEAGIQIRERRDSGLSGTRSNVENLAAQIARSGERWANSTVAQGAGDFGPAERDKDKERDVARDMGDKLTDYVQGLTASGSQAGAYGINTVQGASQVMGSEFEMSKSQETNNILKAILEQLVASHKMTREQATATGNNIGFRYSDPISNLFGSK